GLGHLALNPNAALHRGNGAREFRDEAVARAFNDTSAKGFDRRKDYAVPVGAECVMRRRLVAMHETRIARDVAAHDRCEPMLQAGIADKCVGLTSHASHRLRFMRSGKPTTGPQ